MAFILNIETATTNCSVSLSKEGKTIVLKEDNDKSYSHAERLHVYIDEVLKFSRERIADNYLYTIKKKFLANQKLPLTKLSRIIKSNKKKPKVIHLITGLERGGAERFLYNLINNILNIF